MRSIWFKHDVSARQDQELAALVRAHHAFGLGVYWTVCELLRGAQSYRLRDGKELESEVSHQLRDKIKKVSAVISWCKIAHAGQHPLFQIDPDGWLFSKRLSDDAAIADVAYLKRMAGAQAGGQASAQARGQGRGQP